MNALADAPIEVVRHPRARRARLAVDPATGAVRLTLPPRVPLRPALAWAATQRDWIARQQASLPAARPFADGATLPFRGEEIAIRWSADTPRQPVLVDRQLCIGGPPGAIARRVERWLRGQALAVLSEATARYAARAGVSITQVAVGDPRRRWGSCAADGRIRYSWRLILAPPFVLDATAAHEVAHRVHMNHGPAFHALVAELYGSDPSPASTWLRRNGAALHWVGRST